MADRNSINPTAYVEPHIPILERELLIDDDLMPFAIIDAACKEGLVAKLQSLKPEYYGFFRGKIAADLAAVSPYLVRLDFQHPFTRWLIKESWGEHWSIFGLSGVNITVLIKHLRMLFTVKTPSGKTSYFRYYDPRIINNFLPACTKQEVQNFMGPVHVFLAESEDANLAHKYIRQPFGLGQDEIVIRDTEMLARKSERNTPQTLPKNWTYDSNTDLHKTFNEPYTNSAPITTFADRQAQRLKQIDPANKQKHNNAK